MLNNQPPEKRLEDPNLLQVHSIFKTIQGEGPFAGTPAIFIRLAGCSICCPNCFGWHLNNGRQPYISMANGPKKKLGSLEVNDKILTLDENGTIVETTVTNVSKFTVDIWYEIIIDGTKYKVTTDHPFFTTRGMITAENIEVGDEILHVHPNDIIAWKKQGDRNPMKDPEVASRSASNRDYVKQGLEVAASIKRRKNAGTYVTPWEKMTLEQQKISKLKASERMKGSGNPNFKEGYEFRNYEVRRNLLRAVSEKCNRCEQPAVLIHHADHNRKNDNPTNFEPLCNSCHSQEHQVGYNFWNGDRSDGKALAAQNGLLVSKVKKVDRSTYKYDYYRPNALPVTSISCAPYPTFLADNFWNHNCDTDYTSSRRYMSFEGIVKKVTELNNLSFIDLIVISGGEPFRQDIKGLLYGLSECGYYIQVETNGTIEPPLNLVYNKNTHSRHGIYVVCSPKTPSINWAYSKISCAFKYVMRYNESEHDGLPFNVLGLVKSKPVARPDDNFTGLIYLQPEDSKDPQINELNQKACLESCLKFGYIFCLQIHKYTSLP